MTNRKLLVVRHAPAEEASPALRRPDPALSSEGERLFARFVSSLKGMNWPFDLVLQSPLLRARQTADILCSGFEAKKKQTSLNLKPLASAQELFYELESSSWKCAAIVGHQPFLSKWLLFALPAGAAMISPSRGSMTVLSFPEGFRPGSGLLRAFIAPEIATP